MCFEARSLSGSGGQVNAAKALNCNIRGKMLRQMFHFGRSMDANADFCLTRLQAGVITLTI